MQPTRVGSDHAFLRPLIKNKCRFKTNADIEQFSKVSSNQHYPFFRKKKLVKVTINYNILPVNLWFIKGHDEGSLISLRIISYVSFS